MSQNARFVNKWHGYYTEDCVCIYCLYYGGNKQGCKLDKCCCEAEKREAAAHGRIISKRGAMRWDG